MAWGGWCFNRVIFIVDITFKTLANDSENNVFNFVWLGNALLAMRLPDARPKDGLPAS